MNRRIAINKDKKQRKENKKLGLPIEKSLPEKLVSELSASDDAPISTPISTENSAEVTSEVVSELSDADKVKKKQIERITLILENNIKKLQSQYHVDCAKKIKLKTVDLENPFETTSENVESPESNEKKENVEELKNSNVENEHAALLEAEKMWFQYQLLTIMEPEFLHASNEHKMEFFDEQFKNFVAQFPIVSKLMICNGDYKQKAFKKYLRKMSHNEVSTTQKRKEKGFMENQWIERQADYAVYLYEESAEGKKNRNREVSKNIWLNAFNLIKKDFDDFKEKHKSVQQKLQDIDVKNKHSLLSEAVNRAMNSHQKPDAENLQKIKFKLIDLKYKQNRENLNADFSEKVDSFKIRYHEPLCIGLGTDVFGREEYENELLNFETKKRVMVEKNKVSY